MKYVVLLTKKNYGTSDEKHITIKNFLMVEIVKNSSLKKRCLPFPVMLQCLRPFGTLYQPPPVGAKPKLTCTMIMKTDLLKGHSTIRHGSKLRASTARRQLCLSLLLLMNKIILSRFFFLISIFICIFKKKIFVISFSIIYIVSILLFMIRTNIRKIQNNSQIHIIFHFTKKKQTLNCTTCVRFRSEFLKQHM